ncbi:hypothetical protein scyTo_0015168 [Scyliorhinus torazame]|uniref:Uncharacterized protein n=1 Tax=Scyliorhinus torazame TaxID=75743 RepID=A0A401P417_SCYTO|nr:hypothetical protein [Scyliorhinus torazame]
MGRVDIFGRPVVAAEDADLGLLLGPAAALPGRPPLQPQEVEGAEGVEQHLGLRVAAAGRERLEGVEEGEALLQVQESPGGAGRATAVPIPRARAAAIIQPQGGLQGLGDGVG